MWRDNCCNSCMTLFREKYRSESIRLPNWDYSSNGHYFLTICTNNRNPLFGKIVDGKMILNDYGGIIRSEWLKSPQLRRELHLDEYIIMPDHIHGIVIIQRKNHDKSVDIIGTCGRTSLPEPTNQPCPHMKSKSLSTFINGFKSATTKQINELRKTPRRPVWQRNYYESIIRDERGLRRIREYIKDNVKSRK